MVVIIVMMDSEEELSTIVTFEAYRTFAAVLSRDALAHTRTPYTSFGNRSGSTIGWQHIGSSWNYQHAHVHHSAP